MYDKAIKKNDTQVHNYAILAPLNSDAFDINNEIIEKLAGSVRQYQSIDINDSDGIELGNAIPIEFMNSITPNGFPSYNLVLKIGPVVMLLRNLNINSDLCNGTKLVIIKMLDNLIVAKIISGRCTGQHALLPRIKVTNTDDELPFKIVAKTISDKVTVRHNYQQSRLPRAKRACGSANSS